MNEKVDIEIARRKLTVDIEGFTPIEINALAQKVDEKIKEIAAENPTIADSSKLAILTALHFAADISRLKEARDTETRAMEHKVEELCLSLQTALAERK
ncbi:MAG: hypothetical protein A3J74_10420 [Elusimicrobia bacterium RIFCSPHIGHO2_02_FULL_57_9]|nr:MAG: hypothetical protein A3J74_10420 [Elusimicrobia bacterium RIFCSPHIGHO2_02_FULL_57_9]